MNNRGLKTFLKTKTSKKDLKVALSVIREFKSNESTTEWIVIPSEHWKILEQLEGYLEELT